MKEQYENIKYLDESKNDEKLLEKLKTVNLSHYCEICKCSIYKFNNFTEDKNFIKYCKYNHEQK